MRERDRARLAWAALLAIAAGALVAVANPVNRIKADLRADAKSFAISLEYGVKALGG